MANVAVLQGADFMVRVHGADNHVVKACSRRLVSGRRRPNNRLQQSSRCLSALHLRASGMCLFATAMSMD